MTRELTLTDLLDIEKLKHSTCHEQIRIKSFNQQLVWDTLYAEFIRNLVRGQFLGDYFKFHVSFVKQNELDKNNGVLLFYKSVTMVSKFMISE